MGLATIGLMDGATGFTVTGGSLKTYTPDGQTVSNGIHVADNTVTDFRVKPHITWKNRNPQRQSDGSYSKGVRTTIVTVPYLEVATGKVYFVTERRTMEYAPEIPAAVIKNARFLAAQCMFDTDAENFNTAGDVS